MTNNYTQSQVYTPNLVRVAPDEKGDNKTAGPTNNKNPFINCVFSCKNRAEMVNFAGKTDFKFNFNDTVLPNTVNKTFMA